MNRGAEAAEFRRRGAGEEGEREREREREREKYAKSRACDGMKRTVARVRPVNWTTSRIRMTDDCRALTKRAVEAENIRGESRAPSRPRICAVGRDVMRDPRYGTLMPRARVTISRGQRKGNFSALRAECGTQNVDEATRVKRDEPETRSPAMLRQSALLTILPITIRGAAKLFMPLRALRLNDQTLRSGVSRR